MSKKDKKNDSSSGIEQAFQIQKRQLLDCQFSIKKLQQRLNDITQHNAQLKRNIDQSGQIYNESLEELTIKNMANEKRLLGLSNEKTRLQIENQQKENRIKSLEKSLFQQQQLRYKDLQDSRKGFHLQLAKYESQLSQYKLYMNERDDLEQERQDLRQKIQMEKANKLRQIADKERQKVQATDKLKDQMLNKINDMRKNLFSLKRQQLSTTTKLIMLQNHQLTSELEYQSKQTQKLIFRNQQLEQKVNSLRQELEIHKQVEQQLAKRSHFSKGVIKKLNLRVNQLQSQIQQLKNELCAPKSSSKAKISMHDQSHIIQSNKSQINQSNKSQINQSNKSQINQSNKSQINQSNKSQINQSSDQIIHGNNKLIVSLEHQLERSQKRYIQLQTKTENLKRQKQILTQKLENGDQKADHLFKMLKKYYDQTFMVVSQPQQAEKQNNQGNKPYEYNLLKLRSTGVQKWSPQDTKLTIQILLHSIQPYLTRSNVLLPSIRRNLLIADVPISSAKSLPKIINPTQRKEFTLKFQNNHIIGNATGKIVTGNLREWGQTVRLGRNTLTRKYKLHENTVRG